MMKKSVPFVLLTTSLGLLLMAATPITGSQMEKPPAKRTSEKAGEEASEGKETLMGFQAWKQKRVNKARADLDAFKAPKKEADDKGASPENGGQPQPTDSENKTQTSVQAPSPEESQSAVDKEASAAPQPTEIAQEKDSQRLKEQAERLRQLEFNLEIALGLTVHDYFALYLKDKNKAEIASVAKKLNPDELSELLVSYRDVLYGAPTQEEALVKKPNSEL